MNAHPLQWHTPAPLWARFGSGAVAAQADDQHRPALLRFAGDDFMDQMLGLLQRDPSQIDAMLARPETWRTPMKDAADAVERTPVPRGLRAIARLRLQRGPKATVAAVQASTQIVEKKQPRTLPLKLYQPAHQRYYLVSASLVCGVGGLPERALARGGEEVGFVVRRLLPETAGVPNSTLREFAYQQTPQNARWQRPADASVLAAGEELLPLFPLNFRDPSDRSRTLWTGFVPVARREDYMGASVDRSVPVPLAQAQRDQLHPQTAAGPVTAVTARKTQFMMEVAEPWKNLVRAAVKARDTLAEANPPEGVDGDGESDAARKQRVFALDLQWQMQSWLILLDFADYLDAHLPTVWQAVDAGSGGALSGRRLELYNWLANTTAMPVALQNAMRDPLSSATLKTAKSSLRDALKAIRAFRAPLEAAVTLYGNGNHAAADWPDFHFLLAGLDSNRALSGACNTLGLLAAADPAEVIPDPLQDNGSPAVEAQLDQLTTLVTRCLAVQVETDAPPLPYALQVRDAIVANGGDEGWFVIRCVYRNRDCGPLHAATLSAPTQQFQLASFFDSDAPARPIRITLPVDTTPAGLRKHPKNTAFVISDALCGQIRRAKGMGLVDLVRSVLPWPLHKDLDMGDGGPCESNGVNIGMICSLSIPIITLCALLMLMIIVSLLDFIFRWMPFFSICFPVPKFSAKKSA